MVKPENPILLPVLKTVFLDRDGVVNEKMQENLYVTSWDHFRVLPGVVEAIGRLNQAGILVIVVSNQRGVALGLYSEDDVKVIHARLQTLLEANGARVDSFYFCPHDVGQCNCRKPLPGLFESAAADFPNIAASTSVMIGDSRSDIDFGKQLGMLTIFIEGDPDLQKPGSDLARENADLAFSSLGEAVDSLLVGRPYANDRP